MKREANRTIFFRGVVDLVSNADLAGIDDTKFFVSLSVSKAFDKEPNAVSCYLSFAGS